MKKPNELIEDYMSDLYIKCNSNNETSTTPTKEKSEKSEKQKKTKKLNKIDNANVIIPTIHNYNVLFQYNYNIHCP